ncbi:MarR family winged helix-turn-helix transcriptional regulator [Faucicola atlantae]|uniref:MarR family transcriptional regulator n=1 Tax=Faucicola atlantae TaxID=34059 RepID=A0A1B8QGG5_9GAMM|nr:MarR family transcriptional regulator [Moraxella atlantae]OBX81137.1 MarR family transcriptional regulator [Moraxella atlantae]
MSQESQAWLQLVQSISIVEAKLAKFLNQQHNIGLTDYRALEILSSSPNRELRMQELAHRLGLNQSSISRMVERLEKNDLTFRDLCPDDKRGVYTVLTKTGQEKLNDIKPDYDDQLNQLFKEEKVLHLLREFDNSLNKPSKA